MAGEDNLIPMSERTKAEQREIARKGGIASGKARSANAQMKKRLEQIIQMTLKEGKADKIKNLADAKGANLTISDALLVKLVTMALSGNVKAINTLMGMLDTQEAEQQQTQQNTGNGFVEALNSTAAEVWANETEEEK